jgi:hypothetical protein
VSWPGTERLVHDWLVADLGVRVCSELPADLAEVMPLIQAVRIGGPHDDNDPYVLIPTVSIDVFAADRAGATELADAVDLSLRRRLPGAHVLGASVGLVRTLSGPSWRPWDDTRVRRFGATYQLWVKTPTS